MTTTALSEADLRLVLFALGRQRTFTPDGAAVDRIADEIAGSDALLTSYVGGKATGERSVSERNAIDSFVASLAGELLPGEIGPDGDSTSDDADRYADEFADAVRRARALVGHPGYTTEDDRQAERDQYAERVHRLGRIAGSNPIRED